MLWRHVVAVGEGSFRLGVFSGIIIKGVLVHQVISLDFELIH
jgi:hypothetical protein